MTPQVEATIIVRIGPDKQIPLTEAEARALMQRLKDLFGDKPAKESLFGLDERRARWPDRSVEKWRLVEGLGGTLTVTAAQPLQNGEVGKVIEITS